MLAAHQVEAAQTNSPPNSSSSVPANPAHTNPALALPGQPPRGNGQPDPSAIISAMAQGPQPGARSIATPSDAPPVGADGRFWFPAIPRRAGPPRACGNPPGTLPSAYAQFALGHSACRASVGKDH